MPERETDVPEVARIASDLIRFDTSNYGGGRANGEREAAEYVGAYLEQLGLDTDYYEPVERRTNVCARVPGRDRDKPALILHGHLDVVPAVAEDWSVDPFAGEIRDGILWGPGAVDMKDMDAMILTAVADVLRAGEQPERDVIVTFFADEENGGVEGSARVVADRRSGSPVPPRRSARWRVLHRGRRPPRVPAAGRREGPHLDQARRPRARGSRQRPAPRQRRDAPRAGRRRPRAHRVAHPSHRHHLEAAGGPGRDHGDDAGDPDALALRTGAASSFIRPPCARRPTPRG